MEKQWRKMTKGQQIKYAIFKTVSEYSFVDWLETWGIEEEDWDKFMDAGKAALPKVHTVMFHSQKTHFIQTAIQIK